MHVPELWAGPIRHGHGRRRVRGQHAAAADHGRHSEQAHRRAGGEVFHPGGGNGDADPVSGMSAHRHRGAPVMRAAVLLSWLG